MNDGFEGHVAVVTGAASGIGLGVAQALAGRGATVVVADVDEEGAERAAAGIERAEAARVDVREERSVDELIGGAADRHGRLDVVVANAGIARVRPISEMTLDDWREVMSVNLDGVFLTVRAAARAMAPRGSGAIVTIGSVTALAGAPGIGHYAAAKAAVVSLTKTLSVELRPAGVRVNCVLPGFADTALVRDNQAGLEALLPEGMTLDRIVEQRQGRMGTPEDVASAVCFLAGDRSPWVNGTGLVIDGGMRASLL